MLDINQAYNQVDKFRSYSSVFSRMSLCPVIENGDYSFLNIKIQQYDNEKVGKNIVTYLDYIKYVYAELRKNYRCEYLYKNTLIRALLKEYGTKNSLILNEFRVGRSVADTVLFNGTSKAFEIKTELDSDKRLYEQLSDYVKIFKESYIVTHESLIDKYRKFDKSVGIICLQVRSGNLILRKIKQASENKNIDIDILMRSIRTDEYKNIIKHYYGILPDVNSFNMFEACKSMMSHIPSGTLHNLFIEEIKKRKSNNSFLKLYHAELKQFCLSLNVDKSQYERFNERLCKPINI